MFERRISDKLPDIKSDILSGMLVGLRKISKEIQIGELTTFNTYNQKFLMSVTKHTLIALIIDLIDYQEEFEDLALDIGVTFEQNYDIGNWKGNNSIFLPFRETLDKLIDKYSWKQVGESKMVREKYLIGYVLYDREKKEFYNFMGNDFDAIRLIKKAEIREENRVRIDEENKIIFFLRNKSAGCVVIFDHNIEDLRLQRYLKTFNYSIQNINWIASSVSREISKK